MFAREILPILGPGAALAITGSVTATSSAAGTTLATATAITTSFTAVTTATEGQGVVLPVSMNPGDTATIANATTVDICVYPPSGGKFNGGTASVPITLAPARSMRCTCYDGSANLWSATF